MPTTLGVLLALSRAIKMRKLILLILVLSAILNVYLFKVTSVKSANEQTDSNPIFTKVGGTPQKSTGPTSIAACEFYRGNWNPPAEKYQSPTIVGYFEEASRLSGVPASVLAGITRVETPTLAGLTDQTLSSYSCPESADEALGPMQVVWHGSHRTDAICDECIAVGAGFLGKTIDQLTRDDYCNLRTGIILGAGFVLKKMQYNFSTSSPTWDPAWTTSKEAIYKLANSYYGSLEYGGVYNYGEDVWNSVSKCKPAPSDSSSGPSLFANFAKDLVGAFASSCGGGSPPDINGGNYKCIENSIPSSAQYPTLAFQEVMRSVVNVMQGGAYQCVGFVSTIAAGITGDYITVGGVAGNVAVIGGLTYPVGEYDWIIRGSGKPIQAGDFPVWSGNPGHIAVVADIIDPDNGVFNVAEANWGGPGRVQTRNVAGFDGGRIAGWLRKK